MSNASLEHTYVASTQEMVNNNVGQMAQKRMVEMSVGSTVIPVGLLPSGARAVCLLSPGQLFVALNIIHCLVYFLSPHKAELVHIQMDRSVIWPSVMSSSQSSQEWVLRGLGCWKNNTVPLL